MNIKKPLISIIMPAYNAEKYINDAIKSILEQSYDNWELLIINDGSTDTTEIIINSFSDSRIYLISQENKGVSAARNAGLSRISGKYITFLDSDDILPFKSLEVRVDYLELHPEINLVDGVGIVKDNSLETTLRVHNPSYTGDLLPPLVKLDSKVFLTYCYMFRREVLGIIRFEEDMTHSEDIFFFMSLANRTNIQYGFVSEPVFIYRVGHDSAMKNLDGLEKGYLLLIKKVSKLSNVSLNQLLFLRLRIARILFLTWLREKNIYRAFNSLISIIKT